MLQDIALIDLISFIGEDHLTILFQEKDVERIFVLCYYNKRGTRNMLSRTSEMSLVRVCERFKYFNILIEI